ncbi:translation elongation factor 2 [Dipsacomyces acuminosporus]|nr:translation elongation factor 2 [Dipsacomyces acuminosporus]
MADGTQFTPRSFETGCHFSILDVFLFSDAIHRGAGQAFPCMLFDHWQLMNGVSSQEGIVKDTVVAIRTRKGLAPEVPAIKNYLDKL